MKLGYHEKCLRISIVSIEKNYFTRKGRLHLPGPVGRRVPGCAASLAWQPQTVPPAVYHSGPDTRSLHTGPGIHRLLSGPLPHPGFRLETGPNDKLHVYLLYLN